jgi:hypothetical protein
MADFMNEQEIQDAMARLAENFRLGYITAAEYNKGMKDATVGIRGYTASLQASMAQLGTSMKQLGAGIYKNTQGVGQFGGAIESGADAVGAYTKKFGPAGQAVGLFTQALAKYVAASLKMSDQLFDSYQKISRAGVVGAGAMSEVYDSLRDFGYTMEGLDNLGNLLGRNSKNFGLFFQSALQGSRAFGQVASQIQNSDLRQQFFRLGMSVDDINDGIAGYVTQQGKLGQIQGKSVDQLAKGSEAYIKELDILTKLTGMTRQEQEDAREQALQIEAFYAGLADLGEAQQEEALKAFTMMYAKGGPKAAAEMASQFNGVITAASDMFLTTGGASMQAFSKEFFARGGTASQSAQMIKDSISPDMAKITQDLNKMGVSLGLNFRTIQNLTKDGMVPLEKLAKELTDEQFKQLTGMDKATAAQSGARDSQIKTAQNLQDFVKMGVGPATSALELFTQAIEYLTSFIPGAGSAKARRDEAAAIKAGKETPTTRATAAYQTNVGAMGYEMGGYGVGSDGVGAEGPTGSMGLKLKSGAENKGTSSDALYGVAQQVHQMLGGDYKYFSGFNDRDGKSKHASGQAFDLVLNDPSQYESVLSQIKGITGISFAQFERAGQKNPNGSVATGDHIHAEVSAAQGAILSGPMGGYKPNLTMHGTEAVVPLNTAAQQAAAGMTDNGTMALQLGKLEEMVSLMKSQLSVSTKIMQYSS